MKKKINAVISCVLIVSVWVASVNVYAANLQEKGSTASITFSDLVEIPIVDPEYPTVTPPDGPTGTGKDGDVAIIYVSSFEFGANKIPTENKTFKSTNEKPFIQISDLRDELPERGWKVMAHLENFKSEGKNTLIGSQLILKNGKIESNEIENNKVENRPSDPPGEITITANDNGSEILIINVDKPKGLGTWVVSWLRNKLSDGKKENSNVTLLVPKSANATQGSHSAEFTWTLVKAD